LDLNELRELIQVLESSGLAELEIEDENQRIRLTRYSPAPPAQPAAPPAPAAPSAPAPAQPAAPAEEGGHELEEGWKTIDSPMVGTFYTAPAPSEPPFVKPGDRVEADQPVCIIEAMKIMNEVTASFPATIEKVLVENGQPVEFGQPLIAVRPAD